MEARKNLWFVAITALVSIAARYQTSNFIVTAPTPQIAEKIGQAAERYRRIIAKEWLGHEMPEWSRPCPIKVELRRGAGGVTSFRFLNGHVFGWNMQVQGQLDQVLDSVLPHEITHTVFASHFRQPLPRWADEGACSTVEHPKERAKQNRFLIQFMRSGRTMSFQHMFRLKEYPRDMLPLYAQGHSLATFLIRQGGKRKFLQYVGDGLKHENWGAVTQQHYGYRGLASLQNSWLDWVRKGSPLEDPNVTSIASRQPTPKTRPSGSVIRAQSEDPVTVPAGRLVPVRSVVASIPSTKPRDDMAGHGTPPRTLTDSSGWHPPSRPLESLASVANKTPSVVQSSFASTSPRTKIADKRSRYDRKAPLASESRPIPSVSRQNAPSVIRNAPRERARRIIGRHLPDSAPRAVAPRRVPSFAMPRMMAPAVPPSFVAPRPGGC